MLGRIYRRRPCGVGPAVRAPGRVARQPGGVAVPQGHRPVAAVPSRRARPRRAQPHPRAAHRLADGGGDRLCRTTSSSPCSANVFPVGNFIRAREQLDYLEEPDCFHDLFGHIPMLADHDFAAMIEHVGRLGTAAIASGHGELVSASIGTASSSASPAKAATSRSSARDGVQFWRGALQPGERPR